MAGTERRLDQQYPNLAHFLARYFRDDSASDRKTVEAVVRTSMRDGCVVEAVHRDLESLLDGGVTDDELDGLGVPFRSAKPGDSRRARLERLRSVLRKREAAIHTLHRYFIWTNRMRNHLEETISSQGPIPDTTPAMSAAEKEAAERAARGWFLPVFFYASYWFAGLYVVTEGWRALGLFDPGVDALLDPTFLGLLRRYRNGIFHYQPTYFDERVLELVQALKGERVGQARNLHDVFSDFFLRWFESRGAWIPRS